MFGVLTLPALRLTLKSLCLTIESYQKVIKMTVKELMEVLKQLDPNKEVMVWNVEWDRSDSVNEVEVDQDGDVVLY